MNCQKNELPFKQCCCDCVHQLEVVTNVNSQHVGHICMVRHELDKSGKVIWQGREHSQGCEMHELKVEVEG